MAAIHIAFMDGFNDGLFREYENTTIRMYVNDDSEQAYRAGQKLGIRIRKEK